MTESTPTPFPADAPVAQPAAPAAAPAGQPYAPTPALMVPAAPPAPVGYAPYSGPVGKIRSTGLCILLAVITFGIYPLVWFFQVHSEMKRHSGQGIDGVLALVLAFFVGIVMPYITSSEVGGLYSRRGQARPVSGATGLWYFPGAFILVGPLVWFIKTNGALNAYWRSLGAA